MQRRSKILNVQKERLVSLVQNHFMKSVGCYENVGSAVIPMEAWVTFANDLNAIGTYKTPYEWKQSFVYMKSRVKSKVAMVLECGASLQDNLSETDQVIYAMYPHAKGAVDREKESNCGATERNSEEVGDTHSGEHNSLSGTSECHDQYGDGQIRNAILVSSRGRGQTRGHGQIRGRSRIRGCGEVRGRGPERPPTQVTHVQKERLLQLLENNFLPAFGRYSGAHGAAIKKRLWESFAEELNALGPYRTSVQWKSLFDYIKGSAKAKMADMRKNRNQAGVTLTRMEERVVAICGLSNMDGEQELGEGGFQYEKTIQHRPKRNLNGSDSDDDEGLGIQIFFSDQGRCSDDDYESTGTGDSTMRNVRTIEGDLTASHTTSLNDTQGTTVDTNERHHYQTNVLISDTQLLEVPQVEGRRKNVSETQTSGLYELTLQSRPNEVPEQRNCDYFEHPDYVMQPYLSDSPGLFSSQSSSAIEHNYARSAKPSSRLADFPFNDGNNLHSDLHNTNSPDNSPPNGTSTLNSRNQNVPDLDHVSDFRGSHSRMHDLGQSSTASNDAQSLPSSSARDGRGGLANDSSHSRSHEPRQSNDVQRLSSSSARVGRGGLANASSHSRPHEPRQSNAVQSSSSSSARVGRGGLSTASTHSRPHEPGQSNGVQSATVSDGTRSGQSEQASVRTGRNRERYRNRYTSYDMVERSINAQERFIEQSNRNHSENIFMFTSALNGFTNVLVMKAEMFPGRSVQECKKALEL